MSAAEASSTSGAPGASPFAIPHIGHPVADSHAHLDMLDDPAAALALAALAGVSFIVTVADPSEDAERTYCELESWREASIVEIEREWLQAAATAATDVSGGESGSAPSAPVVRVLVGVHPHNAKDFGADARAALLEHAQHPLTAGIGEIGLDYHYDHSPRAVQRAVFAEQLEIARELNLPVAIHLREAHDDGRRIMREAGLPREGTLLHCFTGDAALLEPFLSMGCYVSFAGPVTFKKAETIRQAARLVSLERLLVETDSPFMTPEPYRGRANEPALTVLTVVRIAEARGMTPAEVARATWDNSLRLFAPHGLTDEFGRPVKRRATDREGER